MTQIHEVVEDGAAVLAAQKEYLARVQAFFDWWKKGVELAGPRYFGDGTQAGFESAANKDDLRPVVAKIEAAHGYISDGEIKFLAAMYSFFNDVKGAELSAKFGLTSIGGLSRLDANRREVIAGLLMTFSGW